MESIEDRQKKLDDFSFNVVMRAENEEKSKKIYSFWAQNYDSDMQFGGWNGPEKMANIFDEIQLPKTSSILDIGAGTGALGKYLSSKGYVNIDAMDGCPDMLKIAKEKNHYKNYFEQIVKKGADIRILNDGYDAVLLCGCYAPGQVRPDGMDEVVKIVKKRGVIGFIEEGSLKSDVYIEHNKLVHQKIENNLVNGIWNYVEGFPRKVDNMYEGEEWCIHFFNVI